MYIWAFTHKLRFLHVLTFAFERKICSVKLRHSLLAFSLSSWISKSYQPYTVFKVCINILAETYLLICGRADLSWQIYAKWGSCVFFSFFFFFFIITFNMQHAVISIHVRDKLHATDDVTKLLDNFQGLRCGWSSDMQSRTSFFKTSQNVNSYGLPTIHRPVWLTDSYGPGTTRGSHLTSAL